MGQRPEVRVKIIKLLKENIERKLHDIGFGNGFLGYNNVKNTSNNKEKKRKEKNM